MNIRLPLLFLLLAVPLLGRAFTPENGFYGTATADATAGGTAIGVEIQNDYLFAAGFVFNPDGTPTFVTIQGPMKLEYMTSGSNAGRFAWRLNDASALYAGSGGQCIGDLGKCPYKKPSIQSIGGVDIQFTSENEGTMTWGNPSNYASVKLTRFQFMGANAADTMIGIWDFVLDRPAAEASTNLPYSIPAELLAINSATSATIKNFPYAGYVAYDRTFKGSLTIGGVRQLVSGQTVACTGANASSVCDGYSTGNKHVILVYSETDYKVRRVYTFYDHGLKFTGRISGKAALCPEGQADYLNCKTLQNVRFEAFRTASGNFVQTGNGMN